MTSSYSDDRLAAESEQLADWNLGLFSFFADFTLASDWQTARYVRKRDDLTLDSVHMRCARHRNTVYRSGFDVFRPLKVGKISYTGPSSEPRLSNDPALQTII